MITAVLLMALAAPNTPATPEWTAIQRHLVQDRLRLRFLRREELTIKQGLRELERETKKKERHIDTLEDQADKTRDRIEDLDSRVSVIEARLAKLRDSVGMRAAAMLRLRRTNLASVMARALGPGDARRLRERLGRVFEYDATLVRRIRDTSRQDRAARDELEAELAKLIETSNTLEEETMSAAMLREERGALLDAVSKERRGAGRRLSALLQASRRLKKELGVMRGGRPAPEPAPGGFGAQRGRLPWPVSGKVEAIFGKAVDPDSGMVMVQRGIDLRAPQSALVRSVFEGVVAYAARVEGLGRVLIVDHDGFYSIYAHLERYQVRRGQRVGQHQVVGLVGDSDSRKGAFLYFELRAEREALDPLLWLVDG